MADPRTINIGGSRAATQQFELAPGLLQYVQSVYVEIDNSAGAAARPTLTLSEQSGVVIAKKRQGESIPAAGSGSATWALRLADEGGAGIQFEKDPQSGGWLYVETTGTNPATGNAFDLVATGVINVQTTNGYFVTASHAQETVDGDWQIQAAQSGGGSLLLESGDEANLSAPTKTKVDGDGNSCVFDEFGVTEHFVTGTKYTVRGPAFQVLFEVDEDGSLHGKTGKTLTFDR